MKLSWKDMVNTLLVIGGGAIVYAKYYSYSWAVIGSWRSSAAVLGLIGLAMFAFSSFNFANRSILNVAEMMLGSVAIVLAIIGIFVTSHFVFYSLATVLGVAWLIDTARHARHSWIGDEGYESSSSHRHAHVH